MKYIKAYNYIFMKSIFSYLISYNYTTVSSLKCKAQNRFLKSQENFIFLNIVGIIYTPIDVGIIHVYCFVIITQNATNFFKKCLHFGEIKVSGNG